MGLQSQQTTNLNAKFPSWLRHVALCFRAGFAGEGSAAPLALLTAAQPSCPRAAETSAQTSPWLRQPGAGCAPGSHAHCSPWSLSPTRIGEKLRPCLGCRSALRLGVGPLFAAHRLLRSEEDSFETHPNERACQPGEVKAHCLEDLAG